MRVYLNGRFMDKEAAKISVEDRGFLLADGVYEVILSYRGVLYKVAEHLQRLENSLDGLRIGGVSEDFAAIGRRLVQENGLSDRAAVVYLQVTRGAAVRRHAFPAADTPPTVYIGAWAASLPAYPWEKGVRVLLVPDIRWGRCDLKTIGLTPNVLAAQQAKDQGMDEALLVRDGVVTEGSLANFCAVFDGRVQTHPLGERILPGVTRQTVLSLCRELDIPVDETPVAVDRLGFAEELMLLGTTLEVMPVVAVNGRRVGDGGPGPVTRRLREAFVKETREP